MKSSVALPLLLALLFGAAEADGQSGNTTGNLPYAGLMQTTDTAVINRGGVTMRAQPFIWPSPGGVMVSTGTAAPSAILPVNNYCLLGVSGSWQAAPCLPNGAVTATGSPAFGNLAKWAGANQVTNGNLSGDVTTSGTLAATVASIQGTSIAGTTGTSNVVFSNSPNITGAITGQASANFGNVSGFSFIPTVSTPPTNGLYYAAGNEPAIAAASEPLLLMQGISSAVNYFIMGNSTTGSDLSFQAFGTDTNISIDYSTRSAGRHRFFTNANVEQFDITHTVSAVDIWNATGGATGTPGIVTLTATGSDTNITAKIASKGAGTVQSAGHIENALGGTSTPTCGSGCSSITSGSTDVRGQLITGSTVNSITLNFGTAWASAPFCLANTVATSNTVSITTVTTSALTVQTPTNVSGVGIVWHCIQ